MKTLLMVVCCVVISSCGGGGGGSNSDSGSGGTSNEKSFTGTIHSIEVDSSYIDASEVQIEGLPARGETIIID